MAIPPSFALCRSGVDVFSTSLVCARAVVQPADMTLNQAEIRLRSDARMKWRPVLGDDDVALARDVLDHQRVITPLLLTYILILANRSTVLGTAKNGPIYKAVATVCVAVVGLLSFVVLVQTVVGLG